MDKENKIKQITHDIKNFKNLTIEQVNIIKNELNDNEKMDIILLYNEMTYYFYYLIENN